MLKQAYAWSLWFMLGVALTLGLILTHRTEVLSGLTGVLSGVLFGSVMLTAIYTLIDDTRSVSPFFYIYGVLLTFMLMNLDTDGRNIGIVVLALWTLFTAMRCGSKVWAWLTKKDEQALVDYLHSPSSVK